MIASAIGSASLTLPFCGQPDLEKTNRLPSLLEFSGAILNFKAVCPPGRDRMTRAVNSFNGGAALTDIVLERYDAAVDANPNLPFRRQTPFEPLTGIPLKLRFFPAGHSRIKTSNTARHSAHS